MKAEHVKPGESYWTKVGKNWQLVRVVKFSLSLSRTEVIVHTAAGNQIYRDVRQLHKAPRT